MSPERPPEDSQSPAGAPAPGGGAPHRRRFRDRRPEEYPHPDLNPYLKLHREMGRPVVTAEEAPRWRGRWREAFARPAPLHVEVGPGNGFYLAGMAGLRPDLDWLGVEIRFKRVVLCARKILAAGVDNALIARYDAWFLDDLFAPGEIAGLHVNFPDPWKKDRHEKKRLLGPAFAAWAARAMAPGAAMRVKTDHAPNLDRLVAALAGLPLAVEARVADVARHGVPWEDDVVTNYQTKFDRRGEPVHALLIRRLPGPAPARPGSSGE